MRKRSLLLFSVIVAAAGLVWAGFHFGGLKLRSPSAYSSNLSNGTNSVSWAEAVEKIKADRGPGSYVAVEIPPELRHYEDRHWFLAAQVAEVGKHNVATCQDFVDLAAMIQRGEMIPLPAVTNTFVLYRVGEKADEKLFSKYSDDKLDTPGPEAGEVAETLPNDRQAIPLYSESQLSDAYQRLD